MKTQMIQEMKNVIAYYENDAAAGDMVAHLKAQVAKLEGKQIECVDAGFHHFTPWNTYSVTRESKLNVWVIDDIGNEVRVSKKSGRAVHNCVKPVYAADFIL